MLRCWQRFWRVTLRRRDRANWIQALGSEFWFVCVRFGAGFWNLFKEPLYDVERGEALRIRREVRDDAVAQNRRRGTAYVGATYMDATIEDGHGLCCQNKVLTRPGSCAGTDESFSDLRRIGILATRCAN